VTVTDLNATSDCTPWPRPRAVNYPHEATAGHLTDAGVTHARVIDDLWLTEAWFINSYALMSCHVRSRLRRRGMLVGPRRLVVEVQHDEGWSASGRRDKKPWVAREGFAPAGRTAWPRGWKRCC